MYLLYPNFRQNKREKKDLLRINQIVRVLLPVNVRVLHNRV
ncbi:hypothetical protein HMPREF9103_00496 [Lentilactobacillus parafarraginis F0439]|uniref:Uncharacterized protein n=1 Tax=Lentilactobacillus parafarraginis F0439 TaxID=797515 RepID=G9ZL98_9LACO|nr:hypothetical protein HMPREF9103_00496 [Lentilactobacillus parafarraginis F0439]